MSLYWKMHLPEKGEWHEDLDLSVRVACVCMKQGNELNYNKRTLALSQLPNRAAADWRILYRGIKKGCFHTQLIRSAAMEFLAIGANPIIQARKPIIMETINTRR